MKRFLLALCLISTPADAQLLPLSASLQQRPLPFGVSIPAVTSSSVSYPGCPGEVTTHAHTWYIDQALGHTQVGGGLGTLAAPWDSLQALTGDNSGTPTSGYTQILLSTAPGGGVSSPVKPGDLVIVNTGNYGAVTLGASTAIVNSPALTIVAGASQTPLLTTLTTSKVTGLHIGDSSHQGLKVQGAGASNGGLVVIKDGHVVGSTYDIILENMDVSSGSVATFDGYSKATWITNARPGVEFFTQNGAVPSTVMNCISTVYSHIYEVSNNSQFGAIEAETGSSLFQGNEIDHFYPIGINFYGNNTAIGHNYFHDFVQTSQGAQLYAIYPNIDASLDHTKNQSNLYIYNNEHIESVDPSQLLGPAASSFYLNSTGDITNSVVWDNLIAASNECGICMGNSHDYVVANNSIMYTGGAQNPEIELAQAHAGAAGFGTGPVGNPPSNGWVFNNIAPIYNNANGNAIQTYHNIAAPGSTGFANWNYPNVWSQVFVAPTPGSVITLPSITGQQNLIDGGVGGASPQANEFTTVGCTTTAFPCSPQPDWTPLPGSPAATVGGVQLIPPIADFSGNAFTPPYAIGALNPNPTFSLPNGDVLHYISPTGSDAANGLTTGTAWLTPNHALHCGDVVIAAAGSYTTQFAAGNWGAVSSCPSTTGGIDGAGGVNFAVLLCAGPNLGSCPVTVSGSNVKAVDLGNGAAAPVNNWAVEGFNATAGTFGQAFMVDGCNGITSAQHHNAFINNIAHDSGYGFNQSNCGGGSFSNDYFAFVGNIAVNANEWTGGAGTCGGAIDTNAPKNFDTVAGTHIAIWGNYEGGNLGPTPQTDCTSDTEAINLDTLGRLSFSQRITVQDNLVWDTAGYNIQMFYNSSAATAIPILINHNTLFSSCSNFAEGTFNCSEINVQTGVSAPWLVTITNNILRTNAATTSGGGQIYDLNYVELTTAVSSQYTVTGNVFWGLSTTCETTTGITCQPNNSTPMAINCCSATPALPPPTSTYLDPAFTNKADVLANWITNPNCSAFTNTTACMGWNYGAQTATTLKPISDLTPTAGGASGLGYRPPGPCAADANYPTWLKGIVYLQWNGTSLTENPGLVNKPCGL